MTTSTTTIVENRTIKLDQNGRKGILLTFFMIFTQVAGLLISAGSFGWINAWVYAVVMILIWMTAFLIMLKLNPELLNERGKFVKEDTKPFDKLFFLFYRIFNVIFVVIAGFDAVRYEWTRMGVELCVVGIVVVIAGQILILWAMAVNTHFEATVRIQKDRNHQVCTSGPYQFVRHPGYAGLIFFTLAGSFILGSWWSLVPAGMISILVVIRTLLEDRTLQRELDGYLKYTQSTRYRLVPFVW